MNITHVDVKSQGLLFSIGKKRKKLFFILYIYISAVVFSCIFLTLIATESHFTYFF